MAAIDNETKMEYSFIITKKEENHSYFWIGALYEIIGSLT